MRSRRYSSAFTFVELIVVLAIAVVLILVTMPALLDIGRGSKMKASVSQLDSTLAMARQWAITHRERVHVLFPDDHAGLYAGADPAEKEKALRSYVLFVEGKGYVSEWRYLHAGIYFVDSYDTNNENAKNVFAAQISPANNIFRAATLTNCPFPAATSSRMPINAVVFEPDGKPATVDIAPYEIYLAEAIAKDTPDAGEIITLIWKSNPVLRCIAVNKWTGSTHLVR